MKVLILGVFVTLVVLENAQGARLGDLLAKLAVRSKRQLGGCCGGEQNQQNQQGCCKEEESNGCCGDQQNQQDEQGCCKEEGSDNNGDKNQANGGGDSSSEAKESEESVDNQGQKECKDVAGVYCKKWVADGECAKNPDYMIPFCKMSCGAC